MTWVYKLSWEKVKQLINTPNRCLFENLHWKHDFDPIRPYYERRLYLLVVFWLVVCQLALWRKQLQLRQFISNNVLNVLRSPRWLHPKRTVCIQFRLQNSKWNLSNVAFYKCLILKLYENQKLISDWNVSKRTVSLLKTTTTRVSHHSSNLCHEL